VRVLVVDDEEVVREAIVQMAELLGHGVHACGGGREAIEVFPRFAPDVVILDLTMPEMSGREVFQALRSADREIPIVLSSGHSLEKEARELLTSGRVTLLQKPYRISDLRDAIEALLDGRV
jgi:CheY-like chemotaxis protein